MSDMIENMHSYDYNTVLQVLQENNVKKGELKARALALRILGKVFQVNIEI